jgi:hypothetical protein
MKASATRFPELLPHLRGGPISRTPAWHDGQPCLRPRSQDAMAVRTWGAAVLRPLRKMSARRPTACVVAELRPQQRCSGVKPLVPDFRVRVLAPAFIVFSVETKASFAQRRCHCKSGGKPPHSKILVGAPTKIYFSSPANSEKSAMVVNSRSSSASNARRLLRTASSSAMTITSRKNWSTALRRPAISSSAS